MSERVKDIIAPYRDVIVFIVTLLAANYVWKWTMAGDEADMQVTWLGLDVTAPFEFMACHVAKAVYGLISLVRNTAHMHGDYMIHFASGAGLTVTWSCTGLKQSFIWLCLILTVAPLAKADLWLHKAWYIPVGWVVCYAVNILRIAIIALLIEHHPEWFHVLHDYIFKYLFYAILFGMWVIFVEKIRPLSLSH
jgi:exosortase/archaeosortase family protein